jgi:hypothetical protein
LTVIAREVLTLRELWKAIAALAVLMFAMAQFGLGQDSQSLGDVARQARQEKQNKDAQPKSDGKTSAPKVITNEEIGSHSGPAPSSEAGARNNASGESGAAASTNSSGAKTSAEEWKSQIRAQKDAVNALQADIDKENDSIQFAPGNCVSGCVQWNEHQIQKQQDVERKRSQLDTLKQHLQDMQESARQQGYGSSVYDP